ncbi:hypothetical protein FS837_011443 [Tulasnella sp. UAMH 9824]|nr:hypothetical protein FS837_011443 [Tulasnella sp. UAMH 9824]
MASHQSAELMVLKQHGEWIRRYWRGTIEKSFLENQRNATVEIYILEWTQKTIESVTETLTREQFDEGPERGYIPPWSSPFVTGPVILSDQLHKRISPLGEQLANARWRQNNLVPIARLPPEILIDVFDFVLDEGPSVWRDDTNILLTILSRICRHWAELVDNAPRLWSHISPYCSVMKHVVMALEKSKPYPLTCHFDEEEMPHIWLDNFVGAIKQHAKRWKFLDLHFCSSQTLRTVNSRLANVCPPRLERIRVSLKPKETAAALPLDPPVIEFIKRPWLDALRHLSLDDVGMPFGRYAELRGLKTLEMGSLPHQREVNITELLRALVNCPELEKLLLGNEIVLGEEPISGTPVRLDRLGKINLWLGPAPLHAFLKSIQAVRCTKFHIETSLPREGGARWTEVLLTDDIRPFIRTIQAVLLSVSAIDIEIRNSSVVMDTESEDIETRVCLVFHGGQPAEVGKWMAKCLAQGQAPVSLDIVAHGMLWIEAIPFILSKFQNTTKLTLHGDETICQHAIEFLGTALHMDPAGNQHFPIPRLTFMGFMVECTPKFISMLERRYGQYGETEVPSVERPVGLIKLRLLGGKEMVALGSALVQQVGSLLPGCEVELL